VWPAIDSSAFTKRKIPNMRPAAFVLLGALLSLPAAAQDAPGVVSLGPEGRLDAIEQAKEIRIVFSEPMVSLGRIPERVEAPFVRIAPALPGRFRWSGTTTLIFTPEPGAVRYGTRYDVTVAPTAVSARGRALAGGATASFTTPVVKLLDAQWYRRRGRFDQPVVLALRFNQPVDAARLMPHLAFERAPHVFDEPVLPPETLEHARAVDPAAPATFQAKVAAARAAAAAAGAIAVRPAADWDKERFPASPDLVVLETIEVPPPDTHLRVVVRAGARGAQGPETPPAEDSRSLELEPTFFVDGFRCQAGCDPDGYNPLRFRARVRVPQARPAIRALDVTAGGAPKAVARATPPAASGDEEELDEEYAYDRAGQITLEDAGFTPQPARTYAVVVSPELTAADGQVLGYGWAGMVEHWHRSTFAGFGGGHGVWEAGGGSVLPFHARNLRAVTQWRQPLGVAELMPALRSLSERSFDLGPPGPGERRALTLRPDVIASVGFDLAPALPASGRGIVWAALREGAAIPRARQAANPPVQASVVQVTNLGLTVKDSPQNTLVMVTRLDDGEPVAGAVVSIRTLDNAVAWTGTTGGDGIAMAPRTALRDPEREWEFRFIVTAEKDGDVAYVGSDWNEGLAPWMFGNSLDLRESVPLLRGVVFADRGVYRLGEEAHLKAILRDDTRTITLNEWSGADWAVTLPREAPLGHYEVSAAVAGRRDPVVGRFLVAAYRRPDFRVDVELAGESSLAGAGLKGVVAGRYLFGAAMGGRPVRWTYSKQALADVPRPVADRFPPERWAMTDEDDPMRFPPETILEREAALGPDGQLAIDVETDLAAGRPYEYRLEGEVTDVSRQAISGRARVRVDPAPWYVGLRRPPYFASVASGLETEVVAADVAGQPAAGVAVEVTLTQIQWHAVRRAEGGGFYTWESERREVPGGRFEVTTTADPAPLKIPLPAGGYFVLRATAKDASGRSTTSSVSFYVLGPGFTAWERFDHNRIDLVPEKKRYRPGEEARILVKSPWETATALVTTEREGVRTHRTFRLRSTQETITVPIPEDAIPNVFVSVVLVKGRTGSFAPDDASDPGKPAFRLGYTELLVDDAGRRLAVTVQSDREEYRPGARARVSVAVRDAGAAAAPSEVTLWAVDYGVLSLTAYRTPDVLPSVYVAKALQVMTEDSRLNIVSRRVSVGKGGDEGGGGGADAGAAADMRRDFRVLAFWLGSVPTDSSGRAVADVTLPESLTTYRIMAVAGDRSSRFGVAEREIRTSKPVLLKPAFPRFLAVGDTAHFGSVVHSLLPEKGSAIVTMRSLDPQILEVAGEARRTVEVPAKGAAEVRFDLRAKAVGRARIQMTAKLRGETDAFEDVIPVEILVSPETVAAYGQTTDSAREKVEIAAGIVPGFGGLHVETASTALVGLGEGARYLVEYPYGCAEQRASATLALALAADLGDAFRLPNVDAAAARPVAAAAYGELEGFQCPDGGFAFWKGQCGSESPYLTSWVLHVMDRGRRLGFPVDAGVEAKGRDYLEKRLGEGAPKDDGWWPAYTAWQTFAVKVLAEGGKPQDSHVTRIFARLDRMPVFAMAYLLDAMTAAGETGPRPAELVRRIHNAVRPEGGSAHVEELSDPYLLWFWSSNVRSTAIVLGTLVRGVPDDPLVPGLVRWLLAARKDGRWDDTQENGTALEALVDYYRKFEAEPPDFRAVVELGRRTLADQQFRGRSAAAQVKDVPLPEVAAIAGQGPVDLAFRKEGAGTLHYMARLRFASSAPVLEGLDQGFAVRREYRRATASGTDSGEPPAAAFKAGDLVRVTLTLVVPKERRYVAVTDPLPAGFEAVETLFATTAADLARDHVAGEEGGDWTAWWMRGGFDRVERHDDRVLLFATRLAEGEHVFSYVARATTAGRFRTAPAHAEEMYEPEVFGRTPTDSVTVAR
jgi:alpha-2-macroglobulin